MQDRSGDCSAGGLMTSKKMAPAQGSAEAIRGCAYRGGYSTLDKSPVRGLFPGPIDLPGRGQGELRPST